jgi:L-iditol 2-dehydrogenase
MKALVLEADKELVYKEVPDPLRPEGAFYLIKVAAAGICGSDIHRGFERGAYYYPLIMGHEFSGSIEEVSGERMFKTGQRVSIFPLVPCYKCKPCSTGDYAQCISYDYYGSRRDGGFAQYLWVPEENIFPVSEDVDLTHAAMTEPCAVALHGVRKMAIHGGETALVFGAGPIGNVVAQWLRILGCGRVMVVDIADNKLAIAELMGFEPIDARNADAASQVLDRTGGKGADKVVEACGLPLTYRQAILSVGCFGEIVFLGNASGDLLLTPTDISSLLRREVTIHGTWNSKVVPRGIDDWSTVLGYMGNRLDVSPLISHTPALSEGVDIFDRIVHRKESFNKVLFTEF